MKCKKERKKKMTIYTLHKAAQVNYLHRRVVMTLLAWILTVMVAFVSTQQTAQALTPEETGRAIAVEMDRRDLNFLDSTASMIMVLRNRLGQESVRHIRTRTLEVPDDGDKILIIFDKPRDIRKTAFLSFTHAVKADDQWIYLPALKRIKRIASKNKSGPFVGSEFAYEDITSNEVEKYTYRYLRDEVCNGSECFVVERYPVDKNSGYTRQIMWVDKEEYRLQKLEFYDRKDELL
jgi:outer membrane lipoprotein-sorting protein